VIPASSQINPDRDKFFNFFGQPSSNPIFGPANSAQQFRFGAQDYLTPAQNILQNCFGNNFSVLNSPISTTIEHRGAHNISATSFSLRHIQTNTWTAHLAGFFSPVEQFCRHSHLSLDKLRQTTFADFRKLELLEKIFAFLQIPHVTPNNSRPSIASQSKFIMLQDAGDALSSSTSRQPSARTKRSGLV